MATAQYDVIVLGSGPAGGHVASRCHAAGLSVALVESDGFGGACPLRGCEPKKVLADAAETVERLHNTAGTGPAGEAHIDWPKLMAFKNTFTSTLSDRVERHYAQKGITLYKGAGRFATPNSIDVGDTRISASRICIATGATPRPLTFPGSERLSTSTEFLDLPELPKRILFLGGGFIAFELAHIAAAAGAQVHIVQRSSRVLRQFDPDLVERLTTQMQRLGVELHTQAPPRSLTRNADGLLELRAGEHEEFLFTADMVVHGAGRIPDIANLNLAAGEVQPQGNGIAVNEFLQSTSNPAVYAAGDAVGQGLPLTPVATQQAEAVATNIINGNTRSMQYGVTPYALFTYPPLAAVGMTEAKAREQGLDVDVRTGDAATWSEYKRIGQSCAGYKLIVHSPDGRLLGAHVLGDRAEETINLFALAIRANLTIHDLLSMTWAYPSFGYTLRYMLR